MTVMRMRIVIAITSMLLIWGTAGAETMATTLFRVSYIVSLLLEPASRALYIATGGTIYRFAAGSSTTAYVDPEGRFVAALKAKADTVYAVANRGSDSSATTSGILRSSDGGASWVFRSSGFSQYTTLRSLGIGPTQGSIYAVTLNVNEGVYRSTDAGDSWSRIETLGSGAGAIAIALTSPPTIYVGMWNGLFRSRDDGVSWQYVGLDQINGIVVDPVIPTTIYVLGPYTSGAVIVRSTDDGATWQPIFLGLEPNVPFSLAVDPIHPEILYVAAGMCYDGSALKTATALPAKRAKIFKSINGGAAWVKIYDSTEGCEMRHLALDPDNPSTLYATMNIKDPITGTFSSAVLRIDQTAVAGDANGDNLATVADVFYLVNYLFAGGPPPASTADVNGDGNVSVADVFALINSLFAGQ